MEKQYEKPIIFKLKTGFMNKFGSYSSPYSRRVRMEIDGVNIDELTEKFGSPVFVFSEKRLKNKFNRIKTAFTSRYPNVEFSWSYKTNYLDSIASILHREGATAEVVSEFEYEKARRLGIEGENIIFNGPYKPKEALRVAAKENARIHIDHFDEINDLEDIVDETGEKIYAAIRLNMDTGIYPQWSRFGFNLENGQALDAIKRIASGNKIIINGLHAHIGTYIMEPKAYKNEVTKMVKFANLIEEKFGFSIEYIDIGGGLPSKSRLKGVYLPPEIAVPSIEDYAEEITDALLSAIKPGNYPKLILETGRAIVDEAGYLVTSVFATKRMPDGKKSYILDAGVNLLFTSFWYHYNVEFNREIQGAPEPSTLFGPLCMNIDVVEETVFLPPLPRGTKIILSPVGAYNVTQWMQFIRYRPAVVLINENKEPELIREKEDLQDIIGREILPERLKLN